MQYEEKNVISNPMTGSLGRAGDPGLQLVVRGPTQQGSPVKTAELGTKRKDMFYGSFRAAIKYTSEPGTCGAVFLVCSSSLILMRRVAYPLYT